MKIVIITYRLGLLCFAIVLALVAFVGPAVQCLMFHVWLTQSNKKKL